MRIRNILFVISVLVMMAKSTDMTLNRSKRSVAGCGVPKITSGLILPGSFSRRGYYPWTIALMYTESRQPKYFCGGTLISSTFVISAAHCIQAKNAPDNILPRNIIALIGAHDLSDHFETERFALSPKRIIMHDDWNPRTTSYDADLSLLEFEAGRIIFNNYVQPICLWDTENEPAVTKGIVTGWGMAQPERSQDNLPKTIGVQVHSDEECFLDEWKLIELSSRRTFCASARHGSGACKGNSGSGFFIKVDGVYFLRGIFSVSLNTDACDIPTNAVYTNVMKFREWIKAITATSHSVCGASKGSTSLAINAKTFPRGVFPWLVALEYTEFTPPRFFCAATIISSTFVLTAAHCINEKFTRKILQPKYINAIFGAHDLSSDDEIERYELTPEKIIIHEEWNANSSQYDADLALLRFKKRSISFNLFVQRICLWNSDSKLSATTGTIAGWGESADKTKIHENFPRRFEAAIHSHRQCLSGNPKISEMSSERTFCAGPRNGTGACRGDSGGGLIILDKGIYYLKGIVSSTLLKPDGDCDTFQNSIYTDVLEFKDWINDKTDM